MVCKQTLKCVYALSHMHTKTMGVACSCSLSRSQITNQRGYNLGMRLLSLARHGMTRDCFVDGGKWLLLKCDCLRPCNFPFVGSRVIVGLHDQSSLRV